jgi:hypothetical protein
MCFFYFVTFLNTSHVYDIYYIEQAFEYDH